MTVKQIYEKLLQVKRPIDFFGELSTEEELKKEYRKYSKKIHPDVVQDKDKYIAQEAFSIMNHLYNWGIDELKKCVYGLVDSIQLYKHMKPLFEITIKSEVYRFYENIFEGEVAQIFKGTNTNDIVYLKVGIDPNDNELLDTEYEVLSTLRHQSLPYVEHKIMINDTNAILMREVKGIPMPELMAQYKRGIPAEHVMWMLERLLSVVGYLHSNCTVHGNIKPENIIINKDNHNVSLIGFSFSIPKANTEEAQYKIVNDFYTAPEVKKTARVLPASDIYSIGMIAIELLGGDIATKGMPICVDVRVRDFIRKMVNNTSSDRPDDAWKLWSELAMLRTEIFGTQRFKKLD